MTGGILANDKNIALRTSLNIVNEIREHYVTKAYLDERLSHYATKEDLEGVNQNMRNWVITVGISATALQFAMQYALFQLYLHAR